MSTGTLPLPEVLAPDALQPAEPEGPRRRPWARLLDLGAGSGAVMAWPVGLFVLITCFVVADLAADLSSDYGLLHLGVETVAVLICLGGTWGTGHHLRAALRRSSELEERLTASRAETARWRREAEALAGGLGSMLDGQFDRWELTAAQREVALLILKGLSHREIAELRQTAEHTVRNQALAIYRKAGISSRAEMAAFFIEDLLLPRGRTARAVRGVATGTDA
ncbi:MAG TPA: LuxR C-terminal-related transcriptional regulator [Anaeromyxobacteraceae bacterium]|nr:LuxR C-terminal-related transcriptional regulator [Anaeromyxobacteraceae bacterium]